MINENKAEVVESFNNDSSSIKSDKCKQKFKTTNQVYVHDITVKWLKKNIPLDVDLDLSCELEKFKEYWSSSSKKKPISGVMGFRRWLRRVGKLRQKKQGGGSDAKQ